MAITKKTRFEVFKRDGFICAYCGSTPPKVTLEVDHIHPKSKGGKDDLINLITSCFDCNRGKGAVSLKDRPNQLNENIKLLAEREEQIRELQKIQKKIARRINKEIEQVSQIYKESFIGNGDWVLTESFKLGQLKRFIEMIGVSEVKEAMLIATSRIDDSERAVKYFCGICWKKAKGN